MRKMVFLTKQKNKGNPGPVTASSIGLNQILLV